MNILIVRLGALGDVVHAIPAAAALRAAYPGAEIDWLVEAKHRAIVDLVTSIDRAVVLERASPSGWLDVIRQLRLKAYDLAIDLQGLLKSAVLARASGAPRVIGFSIWHLREKSARPFYSETASSDEAHVVLRNLRLLRAVGIDEGTIRFPLRAAASRALDEIRARIGSGQRFALVNPGAAWPNKRWPPTRYGQVAAFVRDVCGFVPVVLWGPGEQALAEEVVASSSGAAVAAPPTSVVDLVALSREAALVVSGDTGPLHIAAAVGTAAVGIFGPTDPARNGPWDARDVVVSRYEQCKCHYDRRCHERQWCLDEVIVREVCAAVQRRLSVQREHE
jgi:lipopolysaccharide heptosyltransferase I